MEVYKLLAVEFNTCINCGCVYNIICMQSYPLNLCSIHTPRNIFFGSYFFDPRFIYLNNNDDPFHSLLHVKLQVLL